MACSTANSRSFPLEYPISSDYLTSVALWIRAYKQRFGREMKVSIPQFIVLEALAQHNGSMQPKRIAEYLGLTPSTITATVDNLALAGLVQRRQNPNSRCSMYVYATDAAVSVLQRGRKVAADVTGDTIAPLGRFLHQAMGEALGRIIRSGIADDVKADDPGMHFYRVCMSCDHRVKSLLKSEGLTSLEFRVLFELEDYPHGLLINALAKRLLVRFPDITAVLNALEQHSLIQRTSDAADRRAVRAEITTAGFELLSRAAPQVDALYMTVDPDLDVPSRELFLKAARLICAEQRKSFRP